MISENELLENENQVEDNTEVEENTEIKEETIVDESSENNYEVLEQLAKDNLEIKKKAQRRLIKILISFCTATIIYYICKVFDPFKNLEGNAEVQANEMFKYIKHIMSISSVISATGLVLLFLSKFNLVLEVSRKTLKKIVDVLEWVVILPICIAISSFLFSFVFTITVVDGTSMLPTLYPNEQLVLTYDNSYERFDIVVIDVNVSVYKNLQSIYNSNTYQTLYVKRIIGMPGDYIDYREYNGVTYLYVNGERVEETFFNGNIHNT